MKKRTILCVLGILMAAAVAAGAEAVPKLGLTDRLAKVDGVMGDKEYSLVMEAAGMKLGLTWNEDALFVGLSAPTTGWVAVGLGASKMEGAIMYIGYVTGNETALKVQKGSGHRHADSETNPPVLYAMTEAKGQTVLELALKPTGFISRGQKSLDLVAAMGGDDSFASYHKARAGLTVALAR